jgi:hypothetical protein
MEGLCEHLHEATTRYDHQAKRLDFFLVWPAWRTAKLVPSLDYAPRFGPMGGTVRPLRAPRARPRHRRAA